MKQYFLGVDVGGSKCHAVISDETGKILGFGAGGTGNHEMIGYNGFAMVLDAVSRQAMHSVTKAWTKRAPETILTQKFIEHVGAHDVMDLLEGLSRGRYHLNSAAVMVVFEAAREQDAVALDAIRWLGCELGSLAIGVIRQLHFEELAFDLVLTGSVYKGSSLVAESV